MKPDFRKIAEDVWWEHGLVHDAMANALRAAYAAGLERAAEIAMGVTPPASIGRDHGRHHAAGAQAAARAIRAEKGADHG